MNRSIKVSNEVYGELLQLQRPRETFSEIVGRLLVLHKAIVAAAPMIGGAVGYWRSQSEPKAAAAPDNGPRDSAEVPHV